jgi:hypothetical protein
MVSAAAASQVLRRQTMGAQSDPEDTDDDTIPDFLKIFPRESEMERDIQLKNLLGRQVRRSGQYTNFSSQ